MAKPQHLVDKLKTAAFGHPRCNELLRHADRLEAAAAAHSFRLDAIGRGIFCSSRIEQERLWREIAGDPRRLAVFAAEIKRPSAPTEIQKNSRTRPHRGRQIVTHPGGPHPADSRGGNVLLELTSEHNRRQSAVYTERRQ